MSDIQSTNVSSQKSLVFESLHPAVQKWIYDKKWTQLRDLQERAGQIILNSDKDVILAAATASGKTEAAFLPIVSQIAEERKDGIGVLYISPLKALINDQYPPAERTVRYG